MSGSTHTFHPASLAHGLADGCPRCAEHADDPLIGLDDEHLRSLADRTAAWMRDEPGAFPRSDAELTAMRAMEHVLVRVRALRRAGAL